MTQTITEEQRETPVVRNTDVVICGGGISGVCAAIAAARAGADVALIERYGYLGGITTAWQVPEFYCFGSPEKAYITGIPDEIKNRLEEQGGWEDEGWHPGDGVADCELMKWVMLQMLLEEGVEVLFHRWIAGAVVEDGTVRGVIVESKSGRGAVLGRVVVDCTGDGDLAPPAGADWRPNDENDGSPIRCSLGVGLVGVDDEEFDAFREQYPERYKQIQDDVPTWDEARVIVLDSMGGRASQFWPEGYHQFMVHIIGDCTDADELTRMEVATLRTAMACLDRFRREVPGWQAARLYRLAPQFGVREGRRYVGDYVLTDQDLADGTDFEDAVYRNFTSGHEYTVPYRSLLPAGLDGLLVGCRALSVSKGAFAALRLIGQAMGLGQAAGAAAGLAAAQGVTPRELDPQDVRGYLGDLGATV